MICCDTCPYSPACEEEEDFLRDIGLDPDEPECGSLCVEGRRVKLVADQAEAAIRRASEHTRSAS